MQEFARTRHPHSARRKQRGRSAPGNRPRPTPDVRRRSRGPGPVVRSHALPAQPAARRNQHRRATIFVRRSPALRRSAPRVPDPSAPRHARRSHGRAPPRISSVTIPSSRNLPALRWEPSHSCGGGALQRSENAPRVTMRFSAGNCVGAGVYYRPVWALGFAPNAKRASPDP